MDTPKQKEMWSTVGDMEESSEGELKEKGLRTLAEAASAAEDRVA